MKITCGIILEKPNGQILICHPTNAHKNSWSIPKGLNEDLEDRVFITSDNTEVKVIEAEVV